MINGLLQLSLVAIKLNCALTGSGLLSKYNSRWQAASSIKQSMPHQVNCKIRIVKKENERRPSALR